MRYLILILSFFYSGLAITQTSTVYNCQNEAATGLYFRFGVYMSDPATEFIGNRFTVSFSNDRTRVNIGFESTPGFEGSTSNHSYECVPYNDPFIICQDGDFIYNIDTNEYLQSFFGFLYLRRTLNSNPGTDGPVFIKGTCSSF